ncbi:MAG: peptide ABC transporter substrate-binding protein, partial [Halioglobus sp.]|nr:peptide ABC transporter substrate-binding protein [Halioglobus sp.]
LTNQEWKVYLDSITQMNFQIARRGWIGDYVDPNSFLDLFITGGGNNNTGFADPRYDDLVLRQAPQAATDEARRAIFHEAETLLMEQMPIIPLYTYTSKHLVHPSVSGMPPNLMDSANFKYVFLDQDWRPAGAGN